MTKAGLLPEPLETPRLLLRSPRVQDARAVHAAVHESLPELRPFMVWATPAYSLTDAEHNIRAAHVAAASGEGVRYHLFDKREQFLGNVAFHHIDLSLPKLELGYWLRSRRSGEGLMREAVTALCEVTEHKLGAVRLEIRCDARNVRSARLAEACGFRLERVLEADCCDPQGAPRDTLVFVRQIGAKREGR